MSKHWEEIKNDYIDESELDKGFAEMHIDAWEHGKDQGYSIARIVAVKQDRVNLVKVVYIDNLARVDKYAQEVIDEGIKKMESFNF